MLIKNSVSVSTKLISKAGYVTVDVVTWFVIIHVLIYL